MNLVVLIDYANLFHNIQKTYGLSAATQLNEIEDKICHCLNQLYTFLESDEFSRQKIRIVGKMAVLLPNKVYGTPEERLLSETGTKVKRAEDATYAKTADQKEMNNSRDDDRILSELGVQMIQNDAVNVITVISNDNDFSPLIQLAHENGKYFYAAVFEKDPIIAGGKLKKFCDKAIPIYDLMEQLDEGEAVAAIEEDEEMYGPHLEIYQGANLVLTYPLEKNFITLGRRSLRMAYLPDIDLSAFDRDKIVSRKHAEIMKMGDKLIFMIQEECSRPTWYQKKHQEAGDQFLLQPDEPVILGDKNGLLLIYRED